VSELYELIKRDLEEVVEGEVKMLTSLVECPKARVAEDTVYFEFKVEGSPNLPINLPRLPTMIMYIPKSHVTVLEFKVEFYVDKNTTLAMAIVRYYFTSTTTCFKDSIIIYANIEDIAKMIVEGGGRGGEQ
jgi:hypothetical protein